MTMRRIALLAGLGILAISLPATAAPTLPGSTDVRTVTPDFMQLAQNRTRQISEERGGLFKKMKQPKRKGKKKRM